VASLKNRGDVKSLAGYRSGEGCTTVDTTMVSRFDGIPYAVGITERMHACLQSGRISSSKEAVLLLRNLGTETAVGAVVRHPWQTPPSTGCRQTGSGNPEQGRYLSRWSRWSRSSKTMRATKTNASLVVGGIGSRRKTADRSSARVWLLSSRAILHPVLVRYNPRDASRRRVRNQDARYCPLRARRLRCGQINGVDLGRPESADVLNGFTGVLVIPPRNIGCLPGVRARTGGARDHQGKAIIAEVAVIIDECDGGRHVVGLEVCLCNSLAKTDGPAHRIEVYNGRATEFRAAG
jgi:hypothetical protein